MLGGNSTLNYGIKAHALDIYGTSATHQESTTKHLLGNTLTTAYGSAVNNFQKDLFKCQRKPVYT